MTLWNDATHASLHYYDGDYPSKGDPRCPENFDATTAHQGVAHDVDRYLEIARDTGGPILELCCGTGRVAIPLAAAGHSVTGVDISAELLRQLRAKLERVPPEQAARLTALEADVTELDLAERRFRLAIVAFNSLLCIPSFEQQRRVLRRIHHHLDRGGSLVLDLVNPLALDLRGDSTPKAFFTRTNPHTGNTYTRFAMRDALDEAHCQRLHGWYDEVGPSGTITRRFYSLSWRPIFRYELELMLAEAGFTIERIEGGHQHEPFGVMSPHLFVQARKA
jgi:ubiquinone/menaquinone biosynthesis C-methylase UbiE